MTVISFLGSILILGVQGSGFFAKRRMLEFNEDGELERERRPDGGEQLCEFTLSGTCITQSGKVYKMGFKNFEVGLIAFDGLKWIFV